MWTRTHHRSSLGHAVDHLPQSATLVMEDVTWDDYLQLLEELEDRPGVRVAYDRGKLEIMGPLPEHEEYKRFLERIVDVLGEELGQSVEPRGSATWKRKRDARGVEADSCYYIANAARIVGKREIDLETDPPPDLVVEIDSTNDSLGKFPIYAAFGVPEIWRYAVRADRVHMYALAGEAYVEIPASRAFPILEPVVLALFIGRTRTEGQTPVLAAFRGWVGERRPLDGGR